MTKPQISEFGFLSTASTALQELMTSLATPVHLEPGDVLFEQGDLGDAVYAIISGELEASVLSPEGQKLSLDVMKQGELLGEIALFSPGPRTASVTARRLSEVWGVKNADMLRAVRTNPELAVDMMELAGRRMRWMAAQYNDQVFMDVTTRLARMILHLAGPSNAELRMSHAELATFVGVSRETVSKTLSAWKRNGIVHLGRGTLTVLDPALLKNLSEI